jgi:hypothetical protein
MWYVYIMEFYSAMKKNEILSFASKWWNWRTSSWARLARLRRSKIVCSPSYADFRSRENTAMFLDLGHMLRGSTYGRFGDSQESQNLKVFDVPTAEELI